VSQGFDGQRLAAAEAAGEGVPCNLARCDIGDIALEEVGDIALEEDQWGMAKPIDNSPEEEQAKGRGAASAHTETEEKEIDMKADTAYCRADLGMPC
jgi:hypothetical protein